MILLNLLLSGNIIFLIFWVVRFVSMDQGGKSYRYLILAMFTTAMIAFIELQLMQRSPSDNVMELSKGYQFLTIVMMLLSIKSAQRFSRPFQSNPRLWDSILLMVLFVPFCGLSFLLLFTETSFVQENFQVNGIWAYQLANQTFLDKCYVGWWMLAALYLSCSFFMAYNKEQQVKKKGWLYFLSISLTFIPLILNYAFLIIAQTHYAFYVLSIPMTLCLFLMGWSLTNYRLFDISTTATFSQIMEGMSNLVVIVDQGFLIKYINKTGLDLMEENRESFLEKPLLRLTQKVGILDIDIIKSQCLALGKKDFFQEEFPFLIGDATYYFQCTFSPVLNGRKEISGFLILGNDLTYYKESTAQLQKQTEELEESNMELERFAHIASHDLKTPLRNVASFLNLIERRIIKYQDKELQEFTYLARQGADQMYTLIQDVLEYSKLKNNLSPADQSVDLNEVILTICRDQRDAFIRKDAQLLAEELPIIKGQKTKMLQVFQNLIQNGLKYNENQQPVVKISYKRFQDQHLFGIKDNGIGIDPKYSDKIFEMFKRLHNVSDYQGTGIGLAICKKIIGAHRGTIWVESTPGQGSTFYFTLQDN